MNYFWAVLLIIVGTLFLAGNFDLLSEVQLVRAFDFWPLILVLWGLYLIVRRRNGANWIMTIALLLSALFVGYFVVSDNPRVQPEKEREREEESFQVQERDLDVAVPEGISKGKVVINTGAIKFNINKSTSKLLEGSLTSNFMEPRLRTSVSEKEVTATLDTSSFRRMMFFFRDFKNELNLRLNKNLPLNLEVNTGASELSFDLSELNLSGFLLKAGASDLDLKVGSKVQNGANIEIQAGASDVKIEVPNGIGVKIVSESGLADTDFDGFVKKGTNWETERYGTASKKINLIFRSGASSIKVQRY